MIASVEDIVEENKFVPFKIEITVETIEEAVDLWQRFNYGVKYVKETRYEYGHYTHIKEPVTIVYDRLWQEINNRVISWG